MSTGLRSDVEPCPQKQLLIDDIKRAISEILEIHNREFEALMKGDLTTASEDTEARLKQAREHKNLLIERYRQHVASHGC